jgi:hypothetical protein
MQLPPVIPTITEAISGIGAENVIGVPVDHGARLRVDKLEEQLNRNLANKQAVYAVVASKSSPILASFRNPERWPWSFSSKNVS